MPFGPLIPVVILLMIMLQGCTPKRKNNNKNKNEDDSENDAEIYTEEEGTDAVKETETLEDTECTCNACVICMKATKDSPPIHIKKEGVVIHISEIGRLNRTDVELEGHFLGCTNDDANKICCVDRNFIEGGTWQDYDEENDEGENKETLNRDKSYMICTKYGDPGIIYFYNDGQEILNNRDKILEEYMIGKHIEDNGICILNVKNRDSQVAFLNSILKGAVSEELKNGIPWQVTLYQAAIETQWGDKTPIDIYTGTDSNNLFGIKYAGLPTDDPSLFVRSWTKEHINDGDLLYWQKEQKRWALNGELIRNNGKRDNKGKLIIEVIQPFKRFSSKDESIILHSETLNSSYYTGVEVYKDNPYEYLKAIAPIYATATDYYDNGEIIINKYMYWNEKNEQKP